MGLFHVFMVVMLVFSITISYCCYFGADVIIALVAGFLCVLLGMYVHLIYVGSLDGNILQYCFD